VGDHPVVRTERLSRGSRVALLVAVCALALWTTYTFGYSVISGPRGSDPEIYWPSVALIGLVLAALIWLLRKLAVSREL
jgi:hypothetical protein